MALVLVRRLKRVGGEQLRCWATILALARELWLFALSSLLLFGYDFGLLTELYQLFMYCKLVHV